MKKYDHGLSVFKKKQQKHYRLPSSLTNSKKTECPAPRVIYLATRQEVPEHPKTTFTLHKTSPNSLLCTDTMKE